MQEAKPKKQHKVRRFIWRVLKYTTLSVLVLLISAFFIFQMHSVQTWLGKKASAYLSKELKTKIDIKSIKINFFKTVDLEGIYAEDQHHDTLMYGNKLGVEIKLLSIADKKLELDVTKLDGITCKLQKYKGEKDLNFQFIADYFASPGAAKVDTSKSSFTLKYGDLHLSNVRFVYKDFNDPIPQAHGVNFGDIEANDLNGKISNIKIAGDSIQCFLEDLSLVEKSGLFVKKITAHVTVSPQNIRADSLTLFTANSYIHGFYRMYTESFADYSNFLEAVDLEADLADSSYVNPTDIAYFTDVFRGLNEKIKINGYIKGPVANLNSDNLKFSWGNHTVFDGSFILRGLPDVEKTFLKVEAKNLSTHYADLTKFPSYPFYEGKHLQLPKNLLKLGKITFTGKAEGFLNDLFLGGVVNTAMGRIMTDAALSTKGKELAYSGKFRTENLNIGKFFEIDKLGEVSLNMAVNGSGTELKTLKAEISGAVQNMRYNNYVYHNLQVNGNFKNSLFEGKFVSADPNANMAFEGKIDLQKKIPQISADVDLYNFNLVACHFFSADSVGILSGKMGINLRGESIDDVNGTLQADHIKFVKSNGVIKLDNTDLTIMQDENQNSLSMLSSVAEVEINGKFKAQTLQKSISLFLHDYFPTFFTTENNTAAAKNTRTAARPEKAEKDNLTFKVRIKDFEPVATFLNIPLTISRNSVVQGSFDAQKNMLVVSGYADKIEYNKTPVHDWFLSINTSDKEVKLNTGFKRIDIADSVYIGSFNLETTSTDNKSNFQILWDNQSKHKNSGEIDGKLIFTRSSLDLDLGKFFVFTEDSLWEMVGNDKFILDSSGIINFHDLAFKNGMQRVKLEGIISKNPKDQFILELDNFKLSQLNPLLKRSGVDLQGSLTGTTSMSDLYHNVIFSSALSFNKLTLNNTLIGTGELNSFFDKTKNVVSINGFFKRDFEKISESAYNDIAFDGYYYPSKKDSALDVNVHLNQFAIKTLQPFVKGIFTIDKGVINGNANIKGSLAKPQLRGQLELADVKNFKVDYLNAPYEIKSGKVKIEPSEITLDFIPLYDVHGNKAIVYGNIFHDNFTKMKLDFDINTKDFMAMNTTSLQNSSYYGKAYCTGNIGLYGPPDALTIEINAKTAKGTQFFIPLAGPEEVGDNGFIRFVKIDSLTKKAHGTKNDFSGLTLKFNLEATEDAEVQILFDAKAGDAIKARGTGNITMNINTLGGFEMFGTYTINDGSYLFTLENVINKKFDIDNGSTIRWSGDPLNADINIAATYKQRTSLAPFFPQIQTTDQSSATGSTSSAASASSGVDNNKRYPVNCKLYMRDHLLSPDITFGIELPTVTEVIRSQVMGYINNDQELNRQVFSLLLLRTFVTPLQLQQQSGVSAGGAVGNNASELLSNQLNSWLSNFTKAFNLGVNYRPGGSTSNEELDVAVSTQLLNDKLTIDGNVGVNNNNNTKTSTLIGDLNVNYKLTQDGKIQLKAFNRSNDNFQIATLGGQFTQGAGIFYREEFNNVGDLYRRYIRFLTPKKKKKTEVTAN
jgi:hypothetical protein